MSNSVILHFFISLSFSENKDKNDNRSTLWQLGLCFCPCLSHQFLNHRVGLSNLIKQISRAEQLRQGAAQGGAAEQLGWNYSRGKEYLPGNGIT